LDVAAQRSQTTDDDHRVVPFRPRDLGVSRRAPGRTQPPDPPNEALLKYEGGEEREDTYRHRMMVNLAALAFTIVLALAGVWLAMQIANMRKNQDCLLSGRRNCAPIDVPALER
jgi:hypothetical protein